MRQLVDALNELQEVSLEAKKLEEAIGARGVLADIQTSAGWIEVLGFAAAVEKSIQDAKGSWT